MERGVQQNDSLADGYRPAMLTLACALGVLVTLAEPAIGTLKEAAKLVDVQK